MLLSTEEEMKPRTNSAARAIFWGALIAGTLDITQAFIGFSLVGSTPFKILQRIAGGIFGRRSQEMGWTSAAVGLLVHITVAFTAATVYYLASRKLRVLVERPVLCGLFYGELVFLFMYFVVIPISAIGHPHFNMATYITALLSGRLLDLATYALMWTSTPTRQHGAKPPSYASRGLGWDTAIDTSAGPTEVTKGGLVPGYTSQLILSPASDSGVFVSFNTNSHRRRDPSGVTALQVAEAVYEAAQTGSLTGG